MVEYPLAGRCRGVHFPCGGGEIVIHPSVGNVLILALFGTWGYVILGLFLGKRRPFASMHLNVCLPLYFCLLKFCLDVIMITQYKLLTYILLQKLDFCEKLRISV